MIYTDVLCLYCTVQFTTGYTRRALGLVVRTQYVQFEVVSSTAAGDYW